MYVRVSIMEERREEREEAEGDVECEIRKASHFHSSFYSVVWPALGIRPRTVSWVSGGSQYHGF